MLESVENDSEKLMNNEDSSMATLEVIKYGHPTLRTVSTPYTKQEIEEAFVEDMLETMYEEDGIGLAANQVNVAKQMLVCSDRENEYVLFNPKIIATSETMKEDMEGCLSLPGLQANVRRFEKIIVKAMDQHWQSIELKAKGLLAVVLQHEIDHLNGILYIDRADLSTLTWTDADYVDEERRQKATHLQEVQTTYLQKYKSSAAQVFEKARD